MPKVRPLTADQARRTLANKLAPTIDGLRQLATNLGIRSFRCFLTWSKWTGEERGEGQEVVVKRIELLPTPKVVNLDNVSFSPYHGGLLPIGSVRIEKISATYTYDLLTGNMVPNEHEDAIPQPYEFYYEIVEDGRGDPNPVRQKYRLIGNPFRRPGKVDYTLVLERISQDRTREDKSAITTGQEGLWRSLLTLKTRPPWLINLATNGVKLLCGLLYQRRSIRCKRLSLRLSRRSYLHP